MIMRSDMYRPDPNDEYESEEEGELCGDETCEHCFEEEYEFESDWHYRAFRLLSLLCIYHACVYFGLPWEGSIMVVSGVAAIYCGLVFLIKKYL